MGDQALIQNGSWLKLQQLVFIYAAPNAASRGMQQYSNCGSTPSTAIPVLAVIMVIC